MGYTTDFIGHIDIEPPLNEHEMQYLIAFSKTRHCERPGGQYAVASNPHVREDGLSTEQLNAVPLVNPVTGVTGSRAGTGVVCPSTATRSSINRCNG